MGRFYWLKLKRGFYKRHDMRILRAEGGRDAVLFYTELLCESVDHDGRLRYSEKKPYTMKRLAQALEYPEDITKKAIDILKDLDLVQIEKDGTIYLPEAEHMTGSETEWAEKKRKQRGQNEDEDGTPEGQPEDNVPDLSSVFGDIVRTTEGQRPTEKEKEKESEKEKEIEKEKKEEEDSSCFYYKHAPAREEVEKFISEQCPHISAKTFFEHYQKTKWTISGENITDWRRLAVKWEEAAAIKEQTLPMSEEMKIWKEYEKKFGEKVPPAFYGIKWRYVKRAIDTGEKLPT